MDQLLAILAIFLFSVLVIMMALLCFNRLWVRRLGGGFLLESQCKFPINEWKGFTSISRPFE